MEPSPTFVTPVSELRVDLIAEARNHARLYNAKHAWSHLDDEALLKAAGLLRQDSGTGEWSVTPAGTLLFGPNSAISALFPNLRTLIVRRDRPDGKRIEIRTPLNVLETFSTLMNVISDSFPALGTPEPRNHASPETRASGSLSGLRDRAFELVLGFLIKKRDYFHATPATFKLDVEHFAVEFMPTSENTSEQYEVSLIADLTSFWDTLYPEAAAGLESAQASTTMQAYFGVKPVILHGKMVKFLALRPHALSLISRERFAEKAEKPVTSVQVAPPKLAWNEKAAASRNETAKIDWNAPKPMQVSRTARILDFCSTPRNREEIQQHLGMNNRDHFRREVLNPLIEKGRLRQTIPDKPNSPKQRYVTVSD